MTANAPDAAPLITRFDEALDDAAQRTPIATVARRSALHLLGFDTAAAPDWLRPVQFVAILAVATAAVARGRWQGMIFVAMATRILLDPVVHSYHLTGLVVGAVAWELAWRQRRWPLWTVGPVVLPATKLTAMPDGMAVAIVGDGNLWRDRRSHQRLVHRDLRWCQEVPTPAVSWCA